MFFEIFLFEIKYRLKRPDTYLYFLVFFLISAFSFAIGAVPAQGNVHINAPVVLSKYYVLFSVFMMIVTAAIMGSPLYRDLENNTNVYYFSYPITKNGYFWGRFLGSFLFVAIIGSSFLWGSLLGTFIGPKMGLLSAERVGPFHLAHFLQPFFGFLLPNLFLTSSIFFGLVAYTRNIRVIYSSAIILYLSYLISVFALHFMSNRSLVYVLDPFAFTPLDIREHLLSPAQRNRQLITIDGLLFTNRAIWMTIGIIILWYTYVRFSFLRFLGSGKEKSKEIQSVQTTKENIEIPVITGSFRKKYKRNVLIALTKIEWLSMVRDNYFRLIILAGTFFLGFIFFMGFGQRYGVQDFPRTVVLMDIYNHNFLLFIFIIILFYTGEVIHREKTTGFAIINDALPPSNWIFYGSKLLALTLLCVLLATIPIVAGMLVQLLKGFSQFNLPAYFTACYLISLPTFLEMVLFCFAVHTLVNNKFGAHAVGLMIWLAIFMIHSTGVLDYRLFLYSYTPDYLLNDLDGISPSIKPLFWFTIYWFFGAGLLLVLGALFFYRGVLTSFRERIHLAIHRFQGPLSWITAVILVCYLATGAFNYYNVSYLHTWLTNAEKEQRSVAFERQLKKYENLPLPAIFSLKLYEDIFPKERTIIIRALASLTNPSDRPIDTLLLDGDQFSEYSLKYQGQVLPYSIPLVYSRAKFSIFKPEKDSSKYRLYPLPRSLRKGDTLEIEINSIKENKGFSNNFEGMTLLQNGTAIPGVLPYIGYEEREELGDEGKRKTYGLPKKHEELTAQDNPEGVNRISLFNISSLVNFEAVVSTSRDQIAIAPGTLIREWNQDGRHFFHYVLNNPGTYFPFPIISAKYAVLRDTVLASNEIKNIEIYYYPTHKANLERFLAAYKDGLRYFSSSYGPFQFPQMQMFESTTWIRTGTYAHSIIYGEDDSWNADFTSPDQFDYCYFLTAAQLAHQWWSYQVAPNHALGTFNIPEGLSKYGALMLEEKKYGPNNMGDILRNDLRWYLNRHQYAFVRENPLLNSNQDFISDNKAGLVFYGLKDLIGEERMNMILRSFRNKWAYRKQPPYAGSNDLYNVIKENVPDSFQYYLKDNFEKIAFYNNKIIEATTIPWEKTNQYKVHLKVDVNKFYTDSSGNKIEVANLGDYIDVGIFGPDTKINSGRTQINPLYIQKHKFKSGITVLDIIVTGKPTSVGIDPFNKLIDQVPDDNTYKL